MRIGNNRRVRSEPGATVADTETIENVLLSSNVESRASAELGYRDALDALLDPRGRTIRCTPWRRTIRQEAGPQARLYRKVRTRRPSDAAREWRVLEQLRELGLRVPERAFFARCGRATAIGIYEVDGHPVDVILAARGRSGLTPAEARGLIAAVAPVVRRLHDHGLFYRDLYWSHLFAARADGSGIALIDVERVFRPRLRRRRWLVKDLAGLVASWPRACPVPDGFWDAFCARYHRELFESDRRLRADVFAKAERIRARRPRYG